MTQNEAICAILDTVRQIPRGRVTHYAEVAARAGLKGRARLVGKALGMASDADPVPWHRVLRAGGRIAFPIGSEAFEEQARRLRAEQVEVSERGRVDLRRFGVDAERDLDALIWG